MTNSKGSCLCGSVTLQFDSPNKWYHACHCGICRKMSGGPMMAVHAGTDVDITNSDEITIYSTSEWMERGFCKQCGSVIFARLKEQKEYYIPVWLLDNADEYSFDLQVFTDNKPHSYCFAETTKMMTEEDVYKLYAG
ncbi:MAG: GFA family protein [Rickettsiales bacterium]|nr:GFA family protein [Rickettsiales bacterium]